MLKAIDAKKISDNALTLESPCFEQLSKMIEKVAMDGKTVLGLEDSHIGLLYHQRTKFATLLESLGYSAVVKTDRNEDYWLISWDKPKST